MTRNGIQTHASTTTTTRPIGRAKQTREKPMSDLQAIADRFEIEALRGKRIGGLLCAQ
jgi:hypothetical protein